MPSQAPWPWIMTPLLLNRWVFALVQGCRADLQQQQSLHARSGKKNNVLENFDFK